MQRCPDISHDWGPCVTTSKQVIHHLVLYQSCGTNVLFEKTILNISQIPEAQLNSISLVSQFLKGASVKLVMLLHMKAAAKTPQTELGTFIHITIFPMFIQACKTYLKREENYHLEL